MAEIFLARQEGPGGFEKTLVIKRVLPHLARDEKLVTMFLDEARLAARLAHPNIVSISDFGEVDGVYYLCMEYLDGHDLDGILRKCRAAGRRTPATIASLIVSGVCDGLHYAHTMQDGSGRPLGLVHRDISPSNIFVTKQGAVKILDFGIAKTRATLSQTEAGVLKGKMLYMSPEQIRGGALDARSDVFALGLVLYQLLTGVHPFQRESSYASFTAIASEDAPDPVSARADVPAALGAIVLRALARDREQRFQSARELRDELDRFLATCTSGPSASQLQSFMEGLDERASPPQTSSPTRLAETATYADSETEARPPERARRSSRLIASMLALLAVTIGGGVGLMHRRAPATLAPPAPVIAPAPAQVAAPEQAPAAAPAQTPEVDVHASPPGPSAPSRLPAARPAQRAPAKVATTKPPPKEPQEGTLDINCKPFWCSVSIDGRDTGRYSPIQGLHLRAGTHRLTLVNRDAHVQQERDVVIVSGQKTLVLIQF